MTEQQLPEGWKMVKFGDIAKHISKRVEPSETELEIYVGLEHLDPDSLGIKRHGVPSDVAGQKLLVKKGQIIFGKRRAYQRKVAVADWDCICSAHAMVLEANPKNVIPEFLPFFMQSDVFMERAVAISEGSLSPTIKWKVLANQEFLIPSLANQTKLYSALNNTNEVKNKNEQLVFSLEPLKQSLLVSLLLGGINNREFKDSIFGRIPSHWQLVTVGDLTLEHKQGFYTKDKYTEKGCYLIRITDLDNPNVYFDEMPKVAVDKKTIDQFRVLKGDFLFARSGTIGRYGIYDSDEEAIFASYLIRFRFDETKLLTKYFGYFYESIVCARQLRGIAQQGSNVNINAENIKKLKIPLPPIEEQIAILNRLSELDSIIGTSKLKLKKIQTLFHSVLNNGLRE